jgi:hypothetical protein
VGKSQWEKVIYSKAILRKNMRKLKKIFTHNNLKIPLVIKTINRIKINKNIQAMKKVWLMRENIRILWWHNFRRQVVKKVQLKIIMKKWNNHKVASLMKNSFKMSNSYFSKLNRFLRLQKTNWVQKVITI